MDPQPHTADDLARVCVWSGSPESVGAAQRLGAELCLPVGGVMDGAAWRAQADLLLAIAPERLELREVSGRGAGAVFADFTGGAVDHRRRRGGGRRDPIARALGIGAGTRSVLDATAGLGRDAFLFAWLGCNVTAVERSPVVVALLRDALQRARTVPEVQAILEQRLRLVTGDARDVLSDLSADQRPDAVYIDPMYPPRRASALVKKEMRVLRRLVGSDADAGELLAVARRVARRRVVVKRHARSPALGDGPPSFTCVGRSTRFDVYLTAPEAGPGTRRGEPA